MYLLIFFQTLLWRQYQEHQATVPDLTQVVLKVTIAVQDMEAEEVPRPLIVPYVLEHAGINLSQILAYISSALNVF